MQNLIDSGSKIFSKNTIICLGIIALAGFLIRLFYFPDGIPLILDGATYFWYANDLSVSGTFPNNADLVNNGWPTFLSVFFSLFSSENFLEYMSLQRYVTIIISVVTIIPVFILCRKFCGNELSLLAASLFVFQPRIIENSLLGITEPLFILLELTCLVLFLQNNFKFKYLSFGFLALACLVRYEAVFLIIPLSIFFLLKCRSDKKNILRYFIAISIFLLVLLPMVSVRMDTMGYDGIVSHSIAAGITIGETDPPIYATDSVSEFTVPHGVISFIKSAALAAFPIFFIFLPLGFFGFFRNRNFDKHVILLFMIFMSLPIIYAASRDIGDPRYFLTLFPILSVISVYTVKEITRKFNKTKLISVLFIIAILIPSITYLDYNKIDYEHEREAYEIALEVNRITSIINVYEPESLYFHNQIAAASNSQTFPVLSSLIEPKMIFVGGTSGDAWPVKIPTKYKHDIDACPSDICPKINSLTDFLIYERDSGLEHLAVDNSQERPQFIKNVFLHEEEYLFLNKIYDSKEHGYDYHLKIFKIDYEKFDSVK